MNGRLRFLIAASVLVGAVAAGRANGGGEVALLSVGEISFDGLVEASESIVIARVDEVKAPKEEDERGEKLKIATATVLEQWKGPDEKLEMYRSSSSWMCDIASATNGEVVLLFLGEKEAGGFRSILHAGRGRMPIRGEGERRRATLWICDVLLPPEIETAADPENDHDFIRSVDLAALKAATQEAMSTRITLEELIARSEVVVLASVAELSRPSFRIPTYRRLETQVAKLECEETWKGEPTGTITLQPTPSVPCSHLPIVSGETAVYFLGTADAKGRRRILDLGRGRMPVRVEGERRLATVWARDVVLPEGLATEPGPEIQDLWEPVAKDLRSVDLVALKTAVDRCRTAKPPK